jgi:hypothetical protein
MEMTFRNGFIIGFAIASTVWAIATGYIFPSTQPANFVRHQAQK